MKKQKLKLNELKVKSFTTNVQVENQKTVKGGIKLVTQGFCPDNSEGIFVCEIAPITQTCKDFCNSELRGGCRRG